MFSGTWPRSGMMQNGTAYRLPVLVPLTAGTGYGSSPTHSIPTPTTQDHIERRCTSTEMLNFETNKSVSLEPLRAAVPDADGSSQHDSAVHAETSGASQSVPDASGADVEGQWLASGISAQRDTTGGAGWWCTEPDVGRVAHGVPNRVDRLKGLGNAVVPQVVTLIGNAILEHERGKGLERGTEA